MRHLLFAIVLAACLVGGTARAQDYTLPKAKIAKRANKVCVAFHKRSVKQTKGVKTNERFYKILYPIAQDLVADLDALKPGAAVKPLYHRFVAANRKQLPVVRKLRDTAGKVDDATYHKTYVHFEQLGKKAARLAKKLGAPACM